MIKNYLYILKINNIFATVKCTVNMSRACKRLKIKEKLDLLHGLRLRSNKTIGKRLDVLILCKEYESEGITIEELRHITGYSGQSIVRWRCLYEKGGLERLMSSNCKSNRTPVLTDMEKDEVMAKYYENPDSSISELRDWVCKCLGKDIKYITLYKFVRSKPKEKQHGLRRITNKHIITEADRRQIMEKYTKEPNITLSILRDWVSSTMGKNIGYERLYKIINDDGKRRVPILRNGMVSSWFEYNVGEEINFNELKKEKHLWACIENGKLKYFEDLMPIAKRRRIQHRLDKIMKSEKLHSPKNPNSWKNLLQFDD